MEKLHMSIPLCARIQPYAEPPSFYELNRNSQFTVCKCYVQGLGKNQNLSYFSKDVVIKALPTLFNVPVIGHLRDNDDGGKYMGSHDVVVTIDSDGVDIKSVCTPYGVVPMQDTAHFEYVQNAEDNTYTEYLVCDVILWTGRYPELMDAAYSDSFYFNQSMEIEVSEYRDLEEDSRYVEVLDYEYSALCLLGKADDKNSKEHTEPCFPMASVRPYEYNLKTESFTDMLGQLKCELASCFIQDNSKEGGNKEGMPNEVIESILAEFSVNRDSLDFEISDDMSEEELRERLVAFSAEPEEAAEVEEAEEPVSEPDAEEEPEAEEDPEDDGSAAEKPAEEFEAAVGDVAQMPQSDIPSRSATYRQRMEALQSLFEDEILCDSDGIVISETYYLVRDFSDEYVYVERYHIEGNDSETTCRRYPISFNDETGVVIIAGDYEQMVMRWLTPDEVAQLDNMRNEYEALVKFRNERLEADLHNQMDAVIAEFADIRNTDEFATIRDNPYQFATVEELRTACFAARGKVVQPKLRQDYSARMPLDGDDGTDENSGRYGDLFNRYGHRK